tara:strand:- start:33 stop:503 length:471 start_codon:yes stop_codon:yes gene_type:complete
LESRKEQLKKQIIEALKSKDNDLYSLLKSQWAHRFGVESLDELKKLYLTNADETPTNEDNQSEDHSSEVEKEISIKDDGNLEKEITNEVKKVVKSVETENKESFEIKSYEKLEQGNYENQAINSIWESKKPPKVEALIPLPPKPKYSFLKKWLLRS